MSNIIDPRLAKLYEASALSFNVITNEYQPNGSELGAMVSWWLTFALLQVDPRDRRRWLEAFELYKNNVIAALERDEQQPPPLVSLN